MEAIVLAGGLGTRLRPVVSEVPKPMAPAAGRPFLEHLMRHWIAHGVTRFVLSVGYLAEVIVRHFGERFEGVPVAYATEEQPLGTGGGLLRALTRIEAPACLALNGDTFFEVDPVALRALHDRLGAAMTLALFEAPAEGRYLGVELTAEGHVAALGSERSRACNGGVYWLAKEAFAGSGFADGSRCSLESDLLSGLVGRRALAASVFSGFFIDIGIPGDWQRADALFRTDSARAGGPGSHRKPPRP